MNNNNDEYIQLPPFHRETEGAAVQMIWEYLKLSEEERKIVHADLKTIANKDKTEPYKEPEKFRKVKKEEFAAFEETVSNLIASLVLEASDIASWVFVRKYVDEWTLEQMLEDMPHAAKFIIAMDTLFEKNMGNLPEEEYQN